MKKIIFVVMALMLCGCAVFAAPTDNMFPSGVEADSGVRVPQAATKYSVVVTSAALALSEDTADARYVFKSGDIMTTSAVGLLTVPVLRIKNTKDSGGAQAAGISITNLATGYNPNNDGLYIGVLGITGQPYISDNDGLPLVLNPSIFCPLVDFVGDGTMTVRDGGSGVLILDSSGGSVAATPQFVTPFLYFDPANVGVSSIYAPSDVLTFNDSVAGSISLNELKTGASLPGGYVRLDGNSGGAQVIQNNQSSPTSLQLANTDAAGATAYYTGSDGAIFSAQSIGSNNAVTANRGRVVIYTTSHGSGKETAWEIRNDSGTVKGYLNFYRDDVTVSGNKMMQIGPNGYAPIITTPAQLGANSDNLALDLTAEIFRMSSSQNCDLSSIVAPTTGSKYIVLTNIGSFDIYCKHDDGATGTAANRFLCGGAVDVVLSPTYSVKFYYDTVSSRWRDIR